VEAVNFHGTVIPKRYQYTIEFLLRKLFSINVTG
jgi:hypothetical protein